MPRNSDQVDHSLNIPKRFANQAALETFQAPLTDDEFMVLYYVLRERKWTNQEIKDRVQPLRPHLDLLATGE